MTTPEPDPARLRALEEALDLLGDDRLDETSFRRRHPVHADSVLREIRVLADLEGASAPAATPMGPAALQTDGPRRLGEFEIGDEIGRGGMGIVYRAYQPVLDRTVAVKVLPPGYAATAALRERFEREAALAARLTHPAIVRVHSFGDEDGFLYLAMEWIDGESLHGVLRANPERTREGLHRVLRSDGPAPSPGGIRGWVDSIVAIGIDVADALHVAHEHGLIHRDVKPANILLDRTAAPHLADFGLAREASSQSLTASGHLLGTPSYIAPERIAGEDATACADVFALGATLYEALAGHLAFDGGTSATTLNRVLHHDPPPLDRVDRRLPRDLANVIQRSLEKEPRLRYASAAAFRDDLIRFRDGEPVVASRVGPAGRLWRRARRRPVATLAAGVLVAVVIAIVTWAIVERRARDRDREALAERLLRRGAAFEATGDLDAARATYREAIDSAGAADRVRPALARVDAAIVERTLDHCEDALAVEFAYVDGASLLDDRVTTALASLPDRPRVELLRAIHDVVADRPADALARASAHGGDASLAADLIRARALWALDRSDELPPIRARIRAAEPATRLDATLAIADHITSGHAEAALHAARAARKRWPRSTAITFFVGEALARLNQPREARDQFTIAIDAAPRLWRAYVQRGFSCIPVEVAAFDDALRDFQRVREEVPSSTHAIRGIARVWCARPDTRARGLALLDEAIERHPDDVGLLICRGELLAIDPRRFDDAEADLGRAVERAPTDRAVLALISLHMKRRQVRAALALVERSLAATRLRDSTRAILLARRAQLRMRVAPDDAAADFRAAIAIRRDPEFVHGLAVLNFAARNFARAESLYAELIDAGYRGGWSVVHRAICRFNRLDVDRAATDFEDASRLHGINGDVRQEFRVLCRFANGDDDEARTLAAALAPTRRSALVRLWLAHETGGIDGLAAAVDDLDGTVDAPELVLARLWVDAARGRWESVRDAEIPGVVRAWWLGYHALLIAWGRADDTTPAVRTTLQAILAGDRSVATARALPTQTDETREGVRNLLLGLALAAAGDRPNALECLEDAADAIGDPIAASRAAELHALAGNGDEAAHYFGLALRRRLWPAVLVTSAYRAGVRRGTPELDRFVDGDPRGL